ncbi:MAG: tyrosine recombinase XerC [Oscillospiraceae bacterium]|nr:tyrosine recombinase XerC [Oscillospiraceae bacterium]
MKPAILDDCPEPLRDFLFYMETIKGRSVRTVEAYYIDLRTFLRFLLQRRGLVSSDLPFEEIPIRGVTASLLSEVTLSEAYEFLNFTLSERANSAKTRARKVSALRSFYKYLTVKAHLFDDNPIQDLEIPALKKSLPKHLSMEESLELLVHVDGEFKERDYCIITLFLNCGLRLSELVGINLSDLRLEDQSSTLKVTGKGNKERLLYLNDACVSALQVYLKQRVSPQNVKEKNALFLSSRGTRLTARRVEQIVEGSLKLAGLSGQGYSVHKLRHTAATLLYQYGNVDIRVLQQMLGHVNLGTTEIYTHTSSKQLEEAAEHSPLAHVKPRFSPKKPESQKNRESPEE